MRFVSLPDQGNEKFPRVGDAAADHIHLRVDGVGEMGKADAKRLHARPQGRKGQLVPLLGAAAHDLGREGRVRPQRGGGGVLPEQIPGIGDDARGGRALVDAAPVAALAVPGRVGIGGDVPDLPGQPVGAAENFSAQNHAAAHPGAQGDHHHAVRTGAAAPCVFTQGRHIGVVARGDGRRNRQIRQAAAHFLCRAEIRPVQVDAGAHISVVIHRPGNAQPDAQHPLQGDAVFQKVPPQLIGHMGENAGAVV